MDLTDMDLTDMDLTDMAWSHMAWSHMAWSHMAWFYMAWFYMAWYTALWPCTLLYGPCTPVLWAHKGRVYPGWCRESQDGYIVGVLTTTLERTI